MSHPVPDADTRRFWEGVAAGELWLQRCGDCRRAVFYPRAVCPHCFASGPEWFRSDGLATVHSYTVVHRAFGEFAAQAPFTVALVDLDDGVRMMTRIVGAEPSTVRIGQRVQVEFARLDADGAGPVLPCFRPVRRTGDDPSGGEA